jgi:hypothetical protein
LQNLQVLIIHRKAVPDAPSLALMPSEVAFVWFWSVIFRIKWIIFYQTKAIALRFFVDNAAGGVVHRIVDVLQAVGHDLVVGIALAGLRDIADIRIGIYIVMRAVGKVRALFIYSIAQVGIALIGAKLSEYNGLGIIRKAVVVQKGP